MSTWTQRDEAELDALLARKQEVMAQRRAAIESLVGDVDAPSWRYTTCDEVIDWLIKNADAIRDALQPFDSGVRPA